MSQSKPATPPPSLSLQDLLYVVFKHKWKILLCSAAGVAAAAAVYLSASPVYESQAKLLVRYVVDTSAIDQVDSRSGTGPASENIINSEVEILTSWDLATEVAQAVGVDRFVPARTGLDDWLGRTQSPPTLANAARTIRSGLSVSSLSKTNIIVVSFKSYNPELTTQVLKELLTRYFTKHLEVHRSAEAFNFVSQQSDEVRARLGETEKQLKSLKEAAGIISLEETSKSVGAEIAKTRDALKAAQTERAEKHAILQELEKPLPGQEQKPKETERAVSNEVLQQYQQIVSRLATLRQADLELVTKYAAKIDQPAILDEVERTREMRQPSTQTYPRTEKGASTAILSRRFIGAERDQAQALARERYRLQNATGFSYQAGKKDFDTLVKEAEQDIIKQKLKSSLVLKASDDELIRFNQLQKLNELQIENLEKQRKELEVKYPGLAAILPGKSTEQFQTDISAESTRQAGIAADRAQFAGIDARIATLQSHLDDLLKQSNRLSDFAPRIEELERTREIEANNYKYFQASLEKARVDEALDPSKIPNINVVQSPSAAFKASQKTQKVVLGLAAGGVALGLAFAFLMELVINASVKRRSELEALLGLPLVLSIPYLNGCSSRRLQWPFAAGTEKLRLGNGASWTAAPWDSEHFIRPYAEALRDRLVLHLELNGMNHKPKLVALSDCSAGAGASTLAGGLAAALSETGDGKVLLVDMNVGHPEVHPFLGGTPACSLSEALVGEPTPAGENLYLAVATAPESRQAPLIPKKFYDLMPHLKASDFDYIIFDLPPLGQTSVALPMARFMDKFLVIVEAERSNRDFIKRAYSELIASRASVSVIFNKARSYTPKWLVAET